MDELVNKTRKKIEKLAYWKPHFKPFKRDGYQCSNCRYVAGKRYAICPNCGQQMVNADGEYKK